MTRIFMIVMVCLAMGCIDEVEPPDTIEVSASELGKDDAAARLVGRAFKLGVQTQLNASPDGSHWSVHGRSNLELSHLKVTIAGMSAPADVVGSDFRIDLTPMMVEDLVFGAPLRINAHSAERTASLTVNFAPRWINRRGSSKLDLDVALQPVVTPGGVPVLRASATSAEGFSIEAVYTDDDQSPTVIRDFDWKWRFDWTRDQVPYLLDFVEDRVFFTVVDSDDTRYDKSAQLRIKATTMTWSEDPTMEQEAVCSSSVRFCLHHLLPDAVDAQECGGVQEVLACFRPDAAN
ncbi:MAG: hypothetical protein R3E66_02775 [bacterium]